MVDFDAHGSTAGKRNGVYRALETTTFSGQRFYTSEQKLMAAILEDAVDCVINSGRSKRRAALAAEAWHWIFSQEQNWLFSFRVICVYLQVDPGWLRSGIIKFVEQRTEEQNG